MQSSVPDPSPVPHLSHDRLSIAALASGDLSGADRDRATGLVGACEACRQLLQDLRLLSVASRHLPPIRPPNARDFRLNQGDVDRLARGARWRRILRSFGGTRRSVVRPIAATLMTIGLAGIILSAQPLLQFGAAGPAPQDAASGSTYTSAMPEQTGPKGLAPADKRIVVPSGTPADTDGGGGSLTSITNATPSPSERSTSVGPGDRIPWPVAGVFLAAGIGLLVLRRVAVRLR